MNQSKVILQSQAMISIWLISIKMSQLTNKIIIKKRKTFIRFTMTQRLKRLHLIHLCRSYQTSQNRHQQKVISNNLCMEITSCLLRVLPTTHLKPTTVIMATVNPINSFIIFPNNPKSSLNSLKSQWTLTWTCIPTWWTSTWAHVLRKWPKSHPIRFNILQPFITQQL